MGVDWYKFAQHSWFLVEKDFPLTKVEYLALEAWEVRPEPGKVRLTLCLDENAWAESPETAPVRVVFEFSGDWYRTTYNTTEENTVQEFDSWEEGRWWYRKVIPSAIWTLVEQQIAAARHEYSRIKKGAGNGNV